MPTTVAGEPKESSQAVPSDAGQNIRFGTVRRNCKSDCWLGPSTSSIAQTPRKVEAAKAKADKLTGKGRHNGNADLFFGGNRPAGGPRFGSISVSPPQAAQTDDLAAQALATVRQSTEQRGQV